VLVETHSWKDYRTRVMTTRDCMLDTIERVAAQGAAWSAAAKAADDADAKLAGAGDGGAAVDRQGICAIFLKNL